MRAHTAFVSARRKPAKTVSAPLRVGHRTLQGDGGCYSVRVSNTAGYKDSFLAQFTVTPVCVSANLYMGLSLSGGVPGQNYGIYSTYSLTPPITWTSNATVTLSAAGVLWIDTNSPANKPQMYYKVTE